MNDLIVALALLVGVIVYGFSQYIWMFGCEVDVLDEYFLSTFFTMSMNRRFIHGT